MTAITRRSALTAALGTAGAGAVALGLAACSPTSGATDAGGAGSAPAVTPSTDSSGAQTLALSAVPVGGAVSVTVGGQPVVVAQPKAGQVAAFSAICTHQGCVIAPAGSEYACPCHGSTFDAATGKATHGPATLPLDAVKTSVSGDTITFS